MCISVSLSKLKFVRMFRRERIYPFRKADEHPRFVEQEMVHPPYGVIQQFSIQYTPDKNVTEAERINPFPTNHPYKHQFDNKLSETDKHIIKNSCLTFGETAVQEINTAPEGESQRAQSGRGPALLRSRLGGRRCAERCRRQQHWKR